jgi:hypothetical protein
MGIFRQKDNKQSDYIIGHIALDMAIMVANFSEWYAKAVRLTKYLQEGAYQDTSR